MKEILIDLTNTKSRKEIHRRLSEALSLPDYYGGNLDALFDCLTDIFEETSVTVFDAGLSPESYRRSIRRVFRDAEEENPDLSVRFADEIEDGNEAAALYVSAAASRLGRPLFACVETFGCQMNARDSEKIRGVLRSVGYRDTDDEEKADFILYNTCTVREHANQRIYGRLGVLKKRKEEKPHLKIALCGCMMQEKGEAEEVRKRFPFVDLIFGTYNLADFAGLLAETLTKGGRTTALEDHMEELPEDMPVLRKYPFKSGVNITYGCNNFCSYCIVPYVRGREISRPAEDILREVEALAKDGVKEIMLLGQNVNSYGTGSADTTAFPELLSRCAAVPGIRRVRFMTSHPKDFSDALIAVIAENETICRHIHLPVQSGSTRILTEMNRRYTREGYLDLVRRIRKAIPDISLTTDIIVGFPGETEEDFRETLSLVEEVGYDSVFTFLYSKRSGTKAAEMPDQVPEEVAKERFDRLLALVREKAEERCARFTGQIKPVLVEEVNRDEGYLTGRLSENIVVHFPGCPGEIGSIVPVRLDECRGFYYFGSRADGDGAAGEQTAGESGEA